MGSPSASSGHAGSWYRFSLARVAAVAFTVFVLVLAYSSYIDYCVIVPTYAATAQVEIVQPSDPASPDPMLAETELMLSPDVLAPIVTDLELDKIWAKRFRTALDALPMQDSLRYLQTMLRVDHRPGTHVINITVFSSVQKEAADIANAVANRYDTVREVGIGQLSVSKQHVLEGEIAEQAKVVAQKSAAVEAIREQLDKAGIHIAPCAAGLIAADLAAQKSGVSAQVDALAPLRAAQAQVDAQQRALDDLQLKLRQEKNNYQLTESPVRIIALADPPEYPSAPNHSLDLMIALAEAIALALVVPALLEGALWYLARVSPPRDPQSHFPIPPAAATSTDY